MNLCASETSNDSCGTENVWMMIKAMCSKNDLNEGLDTKRPSSQAQVRLKWRRAIPNPKGH